MTFDLRVCFVGDSFVAGVGDPEHLGWVGRIAARAHAAGRPLTGYNLGVRRDTSDDVIERWRVECSRRLPADCTGAVVLSFGVNDTVHDTDDGGRPRVPVERCAANLTALLTRVPRQGWPVLVVGPAPVADDQHNHRISEVNEMFRRLCGARDTGYVDVFRPLRAHPTWMREVADGDGAHPSAEGYAAYADLVWPHFSPWLGALAPR